MIKCRYLFEKNYKNNDVLRKGFNKLAEDTFRLSFEAWYQNGYWQELYVPYSIIDGEQVVANVSVNIMKFMENGKEKNYIQLGTVMTDKSYRNQGLSKILIEKVFQDYKDKADGFFLYANDSVLDFYPKFGFRKSKEYQYTKQVINSGEMEAIRLSMENKKDWSVLEDAMKSSVSNAAFDMINNPGLIMFYITSFMRECVYYIEAIDTYVIAEIEDGQLLIHNIYAKTTVDLDFVIAAFGKTIGQEILGFTPLETKAFALKEIHEKNTTLFVSGKDFESFEAKKIMFPTLSHA